MTQTELLQRIKEVAYLEGDFTTRAGKKTAYYIDKYFFETLPTILEPLSSALATLFPSSDTYDRIAAPELGAVSLAAVVSIKVNKPFVIVKKESKGYGTKRMIEGRYAATDRMVILEDILTTGGAALRACDILTQEGIRIVSVVGVLNREEGAFENITTRGYPVSALFTSTQLRAC